MLRVLLVSKTGVIVVFGAGVVVNAVHINYQLQIRHRRLNRHRQQQTQRNFQISRQKSHSSNNQMCFWRAKSAHLMQLITFELSW